MENYYFELQNKCTSFYQTPHMPSVVNAIIHNNRDRYLFGIDWQLMKFDEEKSCE